MIWVSKSPWQPWDVLMRTNSNSAVKIDTWSLIWCYKMITVLHRPAEKPFFPPSETKLPKALSACPWKQYSHKTCCDRSAALQIFEAGLLSSLLSDWLRWSNPLQRTQWGSRSPRFAGVWGRRLLCSTVHTPRGSKSPRGLRLLSLWKPHISYLENTQPSPILHPHNAPFIYLCLLLCGSHGMFVWFHWCAHSHWERRKESLGHSLKGKGSRCFALWPAFTDRTGF